MGTDADLYVFGGQDFIFGKGLWWTRGRPNHGGIRFAVE